MFIGGPNPALRDDQAYSQAHYDAACARFGDPAQLANHTLFVDSITVAGRLCLQWSKGQPQAYSDKTDKPDMRGAYGLMGQEMIAWLTHLQHSRGKSVWFVGILEEKIDDFGHRILQLQINGSKTGLELPGIVDEVVTMTDRRKRRHCLPRLRLPHPQSVGLSGQRPFRSPRPDRRTAPRPPDAEDPRQRAYRDRTARLHASRDHDH